MKTTKSALSYIPVYIAGVIIAFLLLTLRILGIWKIEGIENIPPPEKWSDRGLVIVSNHPSLLEPIMLVGLFARWYLIQPKYGPWNVAETRNFRRGLFRFMAPRMLLTSRENVSSGRHILHEMFTLLRTGAIIIFFPEGGRTYRGKEMDLVKGKNDRKVRQFKNGIGLVALETNCVLIPVWVAGTDKVSPNRDDARYSWLPRLWKPVKISIGKQLTFLNCTSGHHDTARIEEVTRAIENAVLNA